MEKLILYQFTISKDEYDPIPTMALVTEETLIARGCWLDHTPEYIAGMLRAFELANYDVNLNKKNIIDPALKENPDAEKLMKLWNS